MRVPARLSPHIALSLLLAATLGCASADRETKVSASNYIETVDKYTNNKKQYDGLQNTLDVTATILNTKVLQAQLEEKARVYQWDPVTYASEEAKANIDNKGKTFVFVSIFSPMKKQDDLSKTKSLWRIFLDSNGRRYEGYAKKDTRLIGEVQRYYPYLTRWTTGYLLEFPVAVESVEQAESFLTLTGPLGSINVPFPAMQ